MMSRRKQYWLSSETADINRPFWDLFLSLSRPQLGLAIVDLFPHPIWGDRFAKLPKAVREGFSLLSEAAISPNRTWIRRRRTYMRERVDLTNKKVFEAYVAYGFHSIHTQAYRRDEPPLDAGPTTGRSDHFGVTGGPSEAVAAIQNHDSGFSMGVRVDDEELTRLREAMTAAGLDREILYVDPKEAELDGKDGGG